MRALNTVMAFRYCGQDKRFEERKVNWRQQSEGLIVMVKKAAKRCLELLGLRLFKLKSMPFGIDIANDMKRLDISGPPYVIFDVGANVGQTAVYLARNFPNSTIFSFEPEPAAFKQLQKNVRSLPMVKPYNCAVGSKDEIRTMYRPEHSDLYTFVPILGTPMSKIADRMEVTVTTIDSFCRSNRIEQIDLLKSDTEGFDLEVLEGSRELLQQRKVTLVWSECEFIRSSKDPHTSFFELYQFLNTFGFRLVSIYTENVGPKVGFTWGCALFMYCNSA